MNLEEHSLIKQSCEYLRSWAYNTLKTTKKSGINYPRFCSRRTSPLFAIRNLKICTISFEIDTTAVIKHA